MSNCWRISSNECKFDKHTPPKFILIHNWNGLKFPHGRGIVLSELSKCKRTGYNEKPRVKTQPLEFLLYLLTQDLPLGWRLDCHPILALPSTGGGPHCCPRQVGKQVTGDLHRLLPGYQVTQYFAWKNSLMYLITDQTQVLHIYGLKA